MSVTINTCLKIQYANTGKAVGIMRSIYLRDYVQGYMQKRSGTLFKKQKDWRRRQAFVKAIKILKSTTRNRIEANGMFLCLNSVPDEGQKHVFDLMGIAM